MLIQNTKYQRFVCDGYFWNNNHNQNLAQLADLENHLFSIKCLCSVSLGHFSDQKPKCLISNTQKQGEMQSGGDE